MSSFNSVEASGSLKVHIRQDSASLVRIETDDNLMEYIEIYVTGSTLVIKEKNGFGELDVMRKLQVTVKIEHYQLCFWSSFTRSGASGDVCSQSGS